MVGQNMDLQLSKGEVEIAELFWDIGLKKNSARILVLMIRDVDLTSREMERACDLRQPEVSIALTDLLKRQWIKNTRQVMENKGRPVKIYHLSGTLEDILDDLKGVIVDDYGRKVLEIERVRELLKTQ